MYWLKSKYKMLCRMFYWGWHMRNSYDYDARTIYKVLYRKLSRLQYEMENDGHCIWNDSNTNLMKKLKESKQLAKKLSKYSYSKNYEQVFKKYKSNKKENIVFFDLHKDAKCIDSALYSFIVRKAFNKDSNEEAYDKKRLFYLLEKYIQHWWD